MENIRITYSNKTSELYDIKFFLPHNEIAELNHGRQSITRLAERGGLDSKEAICIIKNVNFYDYKHTWNTEIDTELFSMYTQWLSKGTEIIAKHYFECHITIEPLVLRADSTVIIEQAKEIGHKYKFKMANLLMHKGGTEPTNLVNSTYDSFFTGHGKDLNEMKNKMVGMINELKALNIKIYRYKIEDIILDSRINDEFNLLDPK